MALVGYGYWRQHLGNSANLAPFRLKIEDKVYSIVGVLPPGFNFPDNTKVWVPRELFEHLPSRTAHNWDVVARLGDNVTLAEARSDLSSIAHRLKQQFGSDIDLTDARVQPQQAFYHAQLGEFLLPYEAVRSASDPSATLMDFLQTTYEAAANLANWDRAALERQT